MKPGFIVVQILVAAALIAIGGGEAKACLAIGQLEILLDISGSEAKSDRRTGTAYVSEYDCAPMPTKTFCALGIRLSDDPTGAGAGIEIANAVFVSLDDRSPLAGFLPKPNKNTERGFVRAMDGTWYGFAGLFNAKPKSKGGLAVRLDFTYAADAAPEAVRAAFVGGHIGLSEGLKNGALAKGHHFEIVQITEGRVQ